MRHGQSMSNAMENHGDGDSKLSSLGIQQAKKIAARAVRLSFDVIISSDFSRALQTAEIIRKRVPRKLVVTHLLREEKHPSELTGKHLSSPNVIRIKKLLHKNRNQRNWRFSDEENFYDLKKRMKKFLRFLEQRKEESILVIGHVMATKMLIGLIIFSDALTPDMYQKIRGQMILKNTGINVCDFTDGQWKLVTWNDHAHLG